MSERLKAEIRAVLSEGQDMAIATLMPDGAPHASTVSYASDGLSLFFGCSTVSQKAQNLALDERVSVTITLPYRDWSEIRGIYARGRARRLPPGEAEDRVRLLFMQKFSDIAQFVSEPSEDLVLFEVVSENVTLLDYRKGFGHVEHVRLSGVLRPA